MVSNCSCQAPSKLPMSRNACRFVIPALKVSVTEFQRLFHSCNFYLSWFHSRLRGPLVTPDWGRTKTLDISVTFRVKSVGKCLITKTYFCKLTTPIAQFQLKAEIIVCQNEDFWNINPSLFAVRKNSSIKFFCLIFTLPWFLHTDISKD